MKRIIPGILILIAMLMAWNMQGAGYVPVHNYAKSQYKGGPQNWAAVQDSIGRIYIGNRDGMMMFDGVRWRTYYLTNYTTVRSMMFDRSSGRIYAGGSEEFGFFLPDKITGDYRYHSLVPMLGGTPPHFSEVWNILEFNGDVWFQTDYNMFKYSGATMTPYSPSGRISRSAIVDRRLFVGMDDGRLLRLDGDKWVEMPGMDGNHGKKITGIMPGAVPGTMVIATSLDGVYIYDKGVVIPLEHPVNKFLKENQIFCAAHHNGEYLFGTVDRGAVALNLSTGLTRFMNKDGGMQNNTVLFAMFDRDGNAWLCLDNGLDYAMLNTAFSTLIGSANEIGAGYASMLYENTMYFGTNQGLYTAHYPFATTPDPLEVTRVLHGQIWAINDATPGLFVAGDAGLYYKSGNSFKKIDGIRGTMCVKVVPDYPEYALAATYDRFHLLKREGMDWVDAGPVSGYDDINGYFSFDSEGCVWYAHFRKGVYRLRLNVKLSKFDDVKLFSTYEGLPSLHDNSVAVLNGEAVISTDNGFYRLNPRTGMIVPDKVLNKSLPGRSKCILSPLPDGRILIFSNTSVETGRLHRDGTVTIDVSSPVIGTDQLIPGSEHVAWMTPDKLVISNQEGFWSVDVMKKQERQLPRVPYVNSVVANGDSLVYIASPKNIRSVGELNLTHDMNTLTIEFAFPEYSGGTIEYSSRLEGYDADWSAFSTKAMREYTRLEYGDYVMRVRAKNFARGDVSEVSFRIHISPPWWHTIWAHIAYIVLSVGVLILSFRFLRKWWRRSRIKIIEKQNAEMEELRRRNEQEAMKKDYEIAALKSQQLEYDVKHKSSELTSTTMNLVRKNEILHEISDEISKIQGQIAGDESMKTLRKQLTKIQTGIKDNISHDDDWKNFTRNFDVVYENFTQRLMEAHPNLTAADQRLCCYIKMRLSSKEIAPLINISYKSVEMARYRLRKKLELPPEANLVDYLAGL